MKWILVIGSIIVVYVLFAPFVKAQDVTGEVEMRASMRNMVCAKDFDFAHRDLTESYGEEVIWEGAVPDGKKLVRLYMNKENGKWTIFELYPDGSGCAAHGGNESILREETSGIIN